MGQKGSDIGQEVYYINLMRYKIVPVEIMKLNHVGQIAVVQLIVNGQTGQIGRNVQKDVMVVFKNEQEQSVLVKNIQ